MLTILLIVLVQGSDLDRIVEKLGDDSPEVRDRAIDYLERQKWDAVPALIAARSHSDPEIRCRARDILFRLEPSLFLDALIDKHRPPGSGLRPVPHPSWEPAVSMEDGWFHFRRRFWFEKHVISGSVITTEWEGPADGLRWDVVHVTAGCEVPVERCAVHSPKLIYVPDDCTDPVRVTIRGTRRWFCEVPVTFRFPANGDRRRVGPYTLIVNWPFVEVIGSDAGPGRRVGDGVTDNQVRCRLAAGRPFTEPSAPKTPEATPSDEPAIFFPEPREEKPAPNVWCGCDTPRKRGAEPPSDGVLRRARLSVGRWKACALTDLESISVEFRLPIEEPFEVTSPPLE